LISDRHRGKRRHAFLIFLAGLVFSTDVYTHGIAGNRFFAGTLTFDDPAVADEAILPDFSYLDYPTQGSNVSENRIRGAFDRLLTPTLAFTVERLGSSKLAHRPNIRSRQDRHWPQVRSLSRQSARGAGFGGFGLGLSVIQEPLRWVPTLQIRSSPA
jgi:hypothetical protein